MEKVTFQEFNRIFNKDENMPKNKEEFMMRLYAWWLIGKQNKEDEILSNIMRVIRQNILKGGDNK